MPVASSSRRRNSRRQASSDIEEDNGLSQNLAPDNVDEEDEEQQPRRSRTTKQEKKTVKSAQPDPNPEDDDDEDDGRIDLEDFHNQPLAKSDAAKLKGLAADWEKVKGSIKAATADLVKDVATSAAEHLKGDQAEKALVELDAVMKELIDLDAHMGAHQAAVDNMYQKLYQGDEEITDVVDRYQNDTAHLIEEYNTKTSRQKYAKNPRYIDFKQDVYESQHDGAAPPPMTDFITREDGDISDDDDDLEIGGVTRDYKCPLTLTMLVKPRTSEICNHSFSNDAIVDFFHGSTGTKKCPAAGCGKAFKLTDCKADKEMAKKVEGAKRRAERKKAEEDDDVSEIVSD